MPSAWFAGYSVNVTVLVTDTDPVAFTLTEKVFVLLAEFGVTLRVDENVPEEHAAEAGDDATAGVTDTEQVDALLTAAETVTSPPSWETGVAPRVTEVMLGAVRDVTATATSAGEARASASARARATSRRGREPLARSVEAAMASSSSRSTA
jgi:hypothetical protein